MELFKSEAFSVTLPEGKRCVCALCKTEPDFETFKSGLLKALEFVKSSTLNCWLFDFREIDELGDEEETWIQVQFFPQLMMLGHENYIAIVVSEPCYNRMVQEVGYYGLKSYNSFIIIDTFCQISEAEEWLLSQQKREAN